MNIRKYLLLPLLLYFQTAQGTDWYRISGDYAVVEFPERLRNVADSLLYTAERAIPRLCAMHGLPLSSFENDPAKIILTDAPDVSNGFAVGKSVVIYALSSAYIPGWTGFTGWYDQVLTHELSHHVAFRRFSRKLDRLGVIVNLSVPRWFYEGTAQYFSESWNLYRGDLYVKNAVLYGKMNYNALFNLQDGRLLYATAHAFTRYLAEQYGDSSLVRLMSHNADGYIYKFNQAFKEVYGKGPEELFPDFIRHMVLYYGDKMAEYPVIKNLTSLPSTGFRPVQIIPLSAADSTYLIATQQHRNHRFLTAMTIRIENKKTVVADLITDELATPLVVSPDHRFIAWARAESGVRENIASLNFRWYVYDLSNRKKQLVASGLRARYAAFTSNNTLVISEVLPDRSIFRAYALTSGETTTVFETAMPVGKLTIHSDDRIVFEAQRPNGNRDLFCTDGNQVVSLTDDREDDRNAFFMSDSILLFNRYEHDQPVVYALNMTSGIRTPLLADQFEYWLSGVYGDRQLVLNSLDPERKPVFSSVYFDSLPHIVSDTLSLKTVSDYKAWTMKKPVPDLFTLPETTFIAGPHEAVRFPQLSMVHLLSIALPLYDAEVGWGIYGTTAWLEPLQRQSLAGAFVLYPDRFEESIIGISHSLKLINLDLYSAYYHGPVIFAYQDGSYQKITRDYAGIGLSRMRYINGNTRLPWQVSLFYTADNLHIRERDRNIFYHGPDLSFSAGYRLPSVYYPAVPKRQISVSLNMFKSVKSDYDFSLLQTSLNLGTNLILEELGFESTFAYITSAGDLPDIKRVGIDRFYAYDIPRDLRYSKTVRGIRRDIFGETVYWNASQLTMLLSERTPFTLLVVPVTNLAVSAFLDAARVQSDKTVDLYSTGAELSFGNDVTRFSLGYARGVIENRKEDAEYYLRVALFLPAL